MGWKGGKGWEGVGRGGKGMGGRGESRKLMCLKVDIMDVVICWFVFTHARHTFRYTPIKMLWIKLSWSRGDGEIINTCIVISADNFGVNTFSVYYRRKKLRIFY